MERKKVQMPWWEDAFITSFVIIILALSFCAIWIRNLTKPKLDRKSFEQIIDELEDDLD